MPKLMHAQAENPATAVERTIAILEAVAAERGGLTNAEISRQLQIPKSTVSYMLRALERHDYIRRDAENGKYRLGLKVLSLGRGALSGLDVREVALPHMRRLCEQTGISSHLAILDGPQAVYVEKVEAPGFIKMDTWIGRRMEVYSTSVGKALVATLPPEQVHSILQERPMKRRTAASITSPAKFLQELETVRRQGYAEDREENNYGVRCVAAPVFNSAGQVEAAVNVTGTTQQITDDSLPRIVDAVQDAARRISAQLGYRGIAQAER